MFRPNAADKKAVVIASIWDIWDITQQHFQHTLVTVLLLSPRKFFTEINLNDKHQNEIAL